MLLGYAGHFLDKTSLLRLRDMAYICYTLKQTQRVGQKCILYVNFTSVIILKDFKLVKNLLVEQSDTVLQEFKGLNLQTDNTNEFSIYMCYIVKQTEVVKNTLII